MKRIVFLLFLLFLLVGCAEEQTSDETVLIESEPVLLQVDLLADATQGELMLDANLVCNATGGNGKYAYSWTGADCSGRACTVHLETVGEVLVGCAVRSGDENEADSVFLTVTKEPVDIGQIIIFGDSLSEGFGLADPLASRWGTLLAGQYGATQRNYAKTGEPVEHIIDVQLPTYRLDEKLGRIEDEPTLVFVWIGANDIIRFIPVEVFSARFETVVDTLADEEYLILLTIPDASKLPIADNIEQGVNQFLADIGISADVQVKQLGKDIIASYNAEIEQIGQERDIPVIDMFSYLETFNASLVTPDQFHPNEAGHRLIAEKIENEL